MKIFAKNFKSAITIFKRVKKIRKHGVHAALTTRITNGLYRVQFGRKTNISNTSLYPAVLVQTEESAVYKFGDVCL